MIDCVLDRRKSRDIDMPDFDGSPRYKRVNFLGHEARSDGPVIKVVLVRCPRCVRQPRPMPALVDVAGMYAPILHESAGQRGSLPMRATLDSACRLTAFIPPRTGCFPVDARDQFISGVRSVRSEFRCKGGGTVVDCRVGLPRWSGGLVDRLTRRQVLGCASLPGCTRTFW